MTDRYVVLHHPVSPEKLATQTFDVKGLAFAYARKRLAKDKNGAVDVQRQVSNGGDWKLIDTWRFLADGNIEHERTACAS